MEAANRFAKYGAPFQFVLISVFLFRVCMRASTPLIFFPIGLIGTLVFGYCLYTLYIRTNRVKKLLTQGLFKYTRHPMYTGMFLMDVSNWFVAEYNVTFLVSTIIFYAASVMAAYFQEKETLARFGKEAEDYYAKTPRMFFLYFMGAHR